MEGGERDSTQDWLVPAGSAPPLLSELELKVDQALAIARASEEGVGAVGEVALEAAKQARRAAELAESASAAALEASRAVAAGNGSAFAGEDERLRHFIERADRVAARLRAVA